MHCWPSLAQCMAPTVSLFAVLVIWRSCGKDRNAAGDKERHFLAKVAKAGKIFTDGQKIHFIRFDPVRPKISRWPAVRVGST